jgi:polyhydroxybutyrate depolymerase
MPDNFLTVSVWGRDRRALIHVPPNGSELLPLVMMFHGAGASAEWTAGETGLSDTADRAGFVVVYPEGRTPNPDQPPRFLDNPQAWADGSDPHDTEDVAFIDVLLTELISRARIDIRRVYVTGFSNGAAMTFRVAHVMSERIAAIAPVAGYCRIDEPRPYRAVPTLYLVGTVDPLVPLDGGEVTTPWGNTIPRPPVRVMFEKWAGALGCPPQAQVEQRPEGEVRTYGPGRNGAFAVLRCVEGLGHHWPGGRGQLSRRLAGPTSNRVRANDVIWEFVRGHRLPE